MMNIAMDIFWNSLGNFGKDIRNGLKRAFSVQHAHDMFGKYTVPSMALVFIYILTNFLGKVYKGRGKIHFVSFAIEFIAVTVVNIIDQYNLCEERNFAQIPIDHIILTSAISSFAFYLLFKLALIVPIDVGVEDNLHFIPLSLVEGTLLFLLYNWTNNYAIINQHGPCRTGYPTLKQDIEDQQKAYFLTGQTDYLGLQRKPGKKVVTTTVTQTTLQKTPAVIVGDNYVVQRS